MASAAAVGANLAYESPVNDIGEDEGRPGEITSAIGRKDDGIAAGEFAEEDEDPVVSSKRRAIANGDLPGEAPGVEDDDLFGDEDGDAPVKAAPRQLDDAELDSGDDLDRTDRVGDEPTTQTQEQEYEQQSKVTLDIELPRQPLPEPSDGELYLMKMPDFLAVEPNAYSNTTFQPPTTDHHASLGKGPSASFSAFNTAMSTLRWRHSPADKKKLQSNARILRWSDGSLTLQLASQPHVQYEVDGNPLAPPQRNALKPTPVSVNAKSDKGGRHGDGTIPGEKYDSSKDAFTYLVVPDGGTQTFRTVHKITAGLSLRQPESVQDDAIERLQAALATAANATKVLGIGNGGEGLALTEEDPEEGRRRQERVAKDKAKADKKRETAILRDQERSNRALGRSGLSSSRYGAGGLSAGMLEDEEGGAAPRSRKAGGPKRSAPRRRNSIYSDDEDFGRKHFVSKEDEYDEEDGFLARSDEEEEEVSDEDPDDGIVEEARERTPKRAREPAGGDDEDADGEVDEEAVAAKAKVKRRRVVDEDEDEE